MELQAIFEKETKRTFRYSVSGDAVGSLYFPKDQDLPDGLTFVLDNGNAKPKKAAAKRTAKRATKK